MTKRRVALVGAATALVATLAGCTGGSAGVTVQGGTTTSIAASPTSSGTAGTSNATPTAESSPSLQTSTQVAPQTSTSPTTSTPTGHATKPPASGNAGKAALAAASAFLAADEAANQDPLHTSQASIDRFLTGPAKKDFDDLLLTYKQNKIAFRGNPPDPRLIVSTVFNTSLVFLSSCPKRAATNPERPIYIATGKPVPTTPATKPYRRDLTMRNVGGSWKLYRLTVNYAKLCTS